MRPDRRPSRRELVNAAERRRPRVLIIVQNLPVPMDRRVWQECLALREAGYGVSVICPRVDGTPSYQVIDGVHIHAFRRYEATGGRLSYAAEFGNGLVRTAALSLRVLLTEKFDVVQTCNPPDTMFTLGRLYRRLGKPFVFDQHDLCPEVFLSRFSDSADGKSSPLLRALYALERATYRAADHVIVTNGSYRARALARGEVAPDALTVVLSSPDDTQMRRGPAVPELRNGRAHLACYLGVMGPQDGVELLLESIAHYVHVLRRSDCHFGLLGFGDCYDELRAQAQRLDLSDYVTFTGRADATVIRDYLSTADVGLSPDPLSPLNDVSTMNKTLEYMAFEVPVVAYDLTETRASAADAALYVQPNDPVEFAKALARLMDDPPRRSAMALAGRRRIEGPLSWRRQASAYVAVFDRLLERKGLAPAQLPEQRDADWARPRAAYQQDPLAILHPSQGYVSKTGR